MALTPPLLVGMAGGKPRAKRFRAPAPRESKLHVDVAAVLRDHCLPDWLWRHISAKAANAREGAIMKRMGVRAGWPDFILISPEGNVRFLELKRLGEEPSDTQKEFRLWCVKHGVTYVIAWNMKAVLAAFGVWGCTRLKLPVAIERLGE
jgi:hypothetical protein